MSEGQDPTAGLSDLIRRTDPAPDGLAERAVAAMRKTQTETEKNDRKENRP